MAKRNILQLLPIGGFEVTCSITKAVLHRCTLQTTFQFKKLKTNNYKVALTLMLLSAADASCRLCLFIFQEQKSN